MSTNADLDKDKTIIDPNQPPPADPPVDNPPPAEPATNDPSQPEPEPEPVPGHKDPLLAALFADVDPNFKKVEDEPDPPTEPPATPPAEPPPQTPPADDADKGKKKKKKKFALIESLDAPAAAPPAAPVPPVPTPAPATPTQDLDAAYIAGLSDEQKEELRESEYAEKLYPERYKGRRAQLLSWYKHVDTETTRLTQENPARTLDDSDEDFSKVLKAKPKMDSAHSKRVMREIAKDEVQAEVRQSVEPKLAELANKQREIEFQPQLNRIIGQLDGAMEEIIASDEASPLTEAIKARTSEPPAGVDAKQYREEMAGHYALENRIMEDEKQVSGALTKEFVMIVKGVRRYDATNETHRQLLEFINQEGQAMRGKTVNGLTFLPRDEYNAVVSKDPSQKTKYTTFNDTDILRMIGFQAKINMENRLQAELEDAKKKGFERRRPAKHGQQSATPPKNPQPVTPPKATSTPSRGPGVQPASAATNDNSINVSEVLELKKLRG